MRELAPDVADSVGRASHDRDPPIVGHERVGELHVEVERPVIGEAGSLVREVVRANKRPEIPTWSVVWLALVPRSRAGRSAVTTTSGSPACAASSTAGWKLATAVPQVQITAARCADLGQAQRQEGRRALVDAGVQPQQARLGRGEGGEGQRCVA